MYDMAIKQLYSKHKCTLVWLLTLKIWAAHVFLYSFFFFFNYYLGWLLFSVPKIQEPWEVTILSVSYELAGILTTMEGYFAVTGYSLSLCACLYSFCCWSWCFVVLVWVELCPACLVQEGDNNQKRFSEVCLSSGVDLTHCLQVKNWPCLGRNHISGEWPKND